MSIDAVRPGVPLAAGAFPRLKFFHLFKCLWYLRSLRLVLALSRCPLCLGIPAIPSTDFEAAFFVSLPDILTGIINCRVADPRRTYSVRVDCWAQFRFCF